VKEVTAEVYALHEPDEDPWYVGCTVQRPNRRLTQHRCGMSPTTNGSVTPDTCIGVIETITGTVEECGAAEVAWIDYGREVGWPLVNISSDGEGAYRGPQSDAMKMKMRGRASPMHGKKPSAETRRRMSETRRRRNYPASEKQREWARRLGEAKRGVPLSDEHKAKLRGKVPWNKRLS
jgi:hypothetical protein